jgi:hypothetical protein
VDQGIILGASVRSTLLNLLEPPELGCRKLLVVKNRVDVTCTVKESDDLKSGGFKAEKENVLSDCDTSQALDEIAAITTNRWMCRKNGYSLIYTVGQLFGCGIAVFIQVIEDVLKVLLGLGRIVNGVHPGLASDGAGKNLLCSRLFPLALIERLNSLLQVRNQSGTAFTSLFSRSKCPDGFGQKFALVPVGTASDLLLDVLLDFGG